MKNNIVFKFIAIVLCAASLLGALGSAAGVLVLSSGDLYNKTVEQVKQENMELFVGHYANSLALQYASSALGGCPEDLATEVYGGDLYAYTNYGYRIIDMEGTVVSAYNEDIDGAVLAYNGYPAGQYMYLVGLESRSEREAREQLAMEQAAQQDRVEVIIAPEGYTDQIPDEGIAVNHVVLYGEDMTPVYSADYYENEYHITYHDGDSSSGFTAYSHFDQLGYLIVNQKGQLVYSSFADESFETLPRRSIHAAEFGNDQEGFFYVADYSEEAIGSLSRNTTGRTQFQTFADEPAVFSVDGTPMLMETVDPEEPVIVMEINPVEESVPVTWPTYETIDPAVEESVPATWPVYETLDPAVMETVAYETMDPAMETVEATTPAMAQTLPPETVPAVTEIREAPEAIPAAVEESIPAREVTPVTEAPTEPTFPETIAVETVPAEAASELINGKPLSSYQVNSWEYWDSQTQEWMYANYVYVPMPELLVEVYVDESSYRDAELLEVIAIVRELRGYLLPAIGISLLLLAIFSVYLCTAAGRKPGTDEVRPAGLNRIPLDLYFLGGGFAIALIAVLGAQGGMLLLKRDFLVGCGFAVAAAYVACLVFVAFCFAFVAQIKTPGGFWWRNTLCGHSIRLIARFAVWLETALATKGFPFLGRLVKGSWKLLGKAVAWCGKTIVWCYHALERGLLWIGKKLGRICRWTGHKLKRFFSLLPLSWQWLVTGFFVVILLILGIDAFKDGHNDLFFPVALLVTFGILFYAAHSFGILAEGVKRMSKGDLDIKVEDKLLVGCFEEFASDLNDLADVAVVAAQKQLKSERMKTELITNVSHDIKTPLTSIINYVDLLQKPHTDDEQEQYLEVLDRQSQRLKKLIDDLMDMSKANTGNMQVDITRLDAVESVNQALGEFADKLDRAKLMPVFRHDEDQVPMMADGKLVWRVLSNLLGNAVKYAMPGTRVYIDLMTLEGKVVLSLKNISREELNIDAEELMERFVRGDDSRNTEGSGLGLNIAKSLMELQKGQLQLLVDGDLFKVTLIFPGA